MDSFVFWISKLAWMLLSPDSLFLLLLCAVWLLTGTRRVAAGRRLLGLLIVALGLLAVFPVDEWLLQPLERSFVSPPALPERVDGVILLGGAEEQRYAQAWDQPELNQSADRYLAFLMLARRYPQAKLVFAGGSASLADLGMTEAGIASRIMRQQDIDPARLRLEDGSRNTAENARRAREMMKPGANENWVLVTSAFHMPRAVGSFCNAGWTVIPYPVDHRTAPGRLLRLDLDLAHRAARALVGAREWSGLIAYYLMGKTGAVIPAGCDKRTAGADGA